MDQNQFSPFVVPTLALSAPAAPATLFRPHLATFADVDAYIREHPDLPVSCRGPWRSSCRRAAWSVKAIQAAGRNEPYDPDMKKLDLASVPFDIATINNGWKGQTYRSAGFTSKSAFRNARSAIRRIGRVAGTVLPCFVPPILPGDPFEPLLQTASKFDKTTIRLFAAWCRQAGLCPAGMDGAALGAYQAYVLAHMVGRRADEVVRLIARLWNRTARRDPDWPQTKLSLPGPHEHYSLPFTAYPLSFQDDVVALTAWMAGTRRRQSPGRREGRKLAMRPETIKNRLYCIRWAAWALVAGGRDPASITGLGCLVLEADMEAILMHYQERAKARQQAIPEDDRVFNPLGTTAQTQSIGATLVMIAQHHCAVAPETLKALKVLAVDFRVQPLSKPTLKNRRRVNALLNDRTKLRCLMRLPRTLMDEALDLREQSLDAVCRAVQANSAEAARLIHQATALARQAAYLGREAVLIGILCRIPLRIKNLHEIRIGTNLLFTGGGSDIVTLCFTEDQTKNRVSLQFYIGPRLHALLQTYIEHFLPFFAASSADYDEKRWLFPSGHRSGPVSIGQLRTIIVRTIAENVGARINPHLFRALAVTLALEQSPDALEHCRQLLGDKTLKVVLRHYAMMQESEAARRQSALVDAEEDRLAQVCTPPSGQRRGRRS